MRSSLDLYVEPSLDLTLSLEPDRLHVAYVMTGFEFDRDAIFLDLPAETVGVPTVDLLAGQLTVQDDSGDVPFSAATGARASTSQGVPSNISLALSRSTSGSVRVSYFARPASADVLIPGGHPPIHLRQNDNGISGQGWTFLALPKIEGAFHFSLHWKIPLDVIAVTSAGVGDVEFVTGLPERILDMFFMVGHVSTLLATDGVSVHSLDDIPSRVAQTLKHYCAKVRSSVASWFGEDTTSHYRVFTRLDSSPSPSPSPSGAAIQGGMIIDLNRASTIHDLRSLIEHECVHEWPCLDGEYENAVWHDEGLAELLSLIIPTSYGDLSTQEFLRRVNLRARLAYASPLRNKPLADLASDYWTNSIAQREPYLRGLFYFARLDYVLRAQGRTTLMHLVRDMRRRRKRGERVNVADWDRIVRPELGHVGSMLMRDVQHGGGELPEPAIWGPGFDQTVQEALVVDPGFGGSCFSTRVVDNVKPGTPAEAAGLRPGDHLLNLPSYLAVAAGRHGRSLDLLVERHQRTFQVRMETGTEVAAVPFWTRTRRVESSLEHASSPQRSASLESEPTAPDD